MLLLKKNLPSLLLGAGTVTTISQVEPAIAAGASFVVTPGLNPSIVEFCIKKGMPIIPGTNSPSQVEQGFERGLKVLKFFPAETSGDVTMLKALHGPYAEALFVPTGGIDISNMVSYLELPYVAAIGGSWIVKEDVVTAGKFAEISAKCREAVQYVATCRGIKDE